MTTCRTHNNITARKFAKGRQVTLEESASLSTRESLKPNFRERITFHPQVVQLSGPHDQLVYVAHKGLVDVTTIAYNDHHDLVWQPDDVWQAILTQFSLYVTHNSEKLRDKFVDFKGKRQLEIETLGTLFTVDFGKLARRMVDEQIVKNIKDPSIADWLIPKFSTTIEK